MRKVFLFTVCLWLGILFLGVNIVTAQDVPIADSKDVSRSFKTSFMLAEVPENAKLHLNFRVDSKGTCPKTYRSTTLRINKKEFELDFRSFFVGQDKQFVFDLGPGVLRQGENKVALSMGACQFGPDTMKLNKLNLTLAQDK